jgi:chaperonin GroES
MEEVRRVMDFRIRPLADRVVVKPQEKEERTRGGIFLPDTASKEKPQEGTIMAVGEGKLDDNGKRTPVAVKAGDRVLFAKYAGTEVKIEDDDYLILAEKDILAIVNE